MKPSVALTRRLAFVWCAAACCTFPHSTVADTIYLTSGKVLDGRIMERADQESAGVLFGTWCDGDDRVVVRTGMRYDTGECVARSDIERVEPKRHRPDRAQRLAMRRDHWGAPNAHYQTQLIPLAEVYTVGRPMPFALVMRNIGHARRWYDAQGVHLHSLRVIGPDGNPVYDKRGLFQTAGGTQPIDPDELATLIDDWDISQDYLLHRPGRYQIQFLEGNYGFKRDPFPASNPVTIEVRAGDPLPVDQHLLALLPVAPKGWRISAGVDAQVRPWGRKPVAGHLVLLEHARRADVGSLVIALSMAEAPTPVFDQIPSMRVSEDLGMSGRWHVYGEIPAEAERLWPDVREALRTALALRAAPSGDQAGTRP